MNASLKKICYVGIYPPTAPRDRVYLDGLKKHGVTVAECVDSSLGIKKLLVLAQKIRSISGQADLIFVGYLSAMAVPVAKLLSRKPVVFNALCSQYESYVLDREKYRKGSPRAIALWILDFVAFHMADLVLVESEEQKKFIARSFHLRVEKLAVLFTGTDESVFFPGAPLAKTPRFSVVFRGIFLPATGAQYVIEAAKLLKEKPIDFTIIGWGEGEKTIREMIADERLSNVTLLTHFQESRELREKMIAADVMLGQFSSHSRLDRTIQHKTFEALALGMPYITRDSKSNRELLEDGTNCIFVEAEKPEAIAAAILRLQADPVLRQRLSENALETYRKRASAKALSEKLIELLKNRFS